MANQFLRDIFKTTGKEAVLTLVERQYDFKLNPDEVDMVVYDADSPGDNAGIDIPAIDPDTYRTIIVTPREGSKYHGKSFFQYRALAVEWLQLNEPFTLNVRLPVTVEQVIDQMELQYGLLFEVSDLGNDAKDVLATDFISLVHPIPRVSLRFYGFWSFVFVDVDNQDLRSVLPPTSAGDLADLYANPHRIPPIE